MGRLLLWVDCCNGLCGYSVCFCVCVCVFLCVCDWRGGGHFPLQGVRESIKEEIDMTANAVTKKRHVHVSVHVHVLVRVHVWGRRGQTVRWG